MIWNHVFAFPNEGVKPDGADSKALQVLESLKPLCTICNVKFAHDIALQKHLVEKHKQSFECKKCEELFDDKFSYQKHMDFIHHGAKKIKTVKNEVVPKNVSKLEQCYICSKTFTETDSLEWHIKYFHSKEPLPEVGALSLPSKGNLFNYLLKIWISLVFFFKYTMYSRDKLYK